MRRLVALLLLLAAASATCTSDYVEPVEAKFSDVLDATPQCPLGADDTLYDDFAEIAEQYSLAAECFYTRGFEPKNENATKYYSLAGDYYTKAAVALCGTDYNREAILYDSAGDSYYDAFDLSDDDETEALSKQAYELALNTYRNHRKDVHSFNEQTYESRMLKFEGGMLTGLGDVQPEKSIDIVPIAIAVLVVFGIILVILFMGKH